MVMYMQFNEYPGLRRAPKPKVQRVCSDARHMPGPLLLYIPPGEEYHYNCPTCGHLTVLRGSNVTY